MTGNYRYKVELSNKRGSMLVLFVNSKIGGLANTMEYVKTSLGDDIDKYTSIKIRLIRESKEY